MSASNELSLFGLSQRLPPANVRAEQALLGAIFYANAVLDQVSDYLLPEHFSDPLHGKIYEICLDLVGSGGAADAVTVHTRLQNTGVLDPVGGAGYLSDLLTAMVTAVGAGEYGKVIYETWLRRQLINAGERLVNEAFDGLTPPEQAAAATALALDTAVTGADPSRNGVSLDQAIDEALERMDARMRGETAGGLPTGFPSLDMALGGLEHSTLTILGGRPGMGKSSLGIQIGLNAARAGKRVQVFSLEMSGPEIGRRLLCAVAGVPVVGMKRGTLGNGEVVNLVAAKKMLRELPLRIDDTPGLTPSAIALRSRAARRRLGGIDLIIVDHIHIAQPERENLKSGGLVWAVGQITGALKRLAKELKVPVLALAQLNRGVEGRDDKRPSLADLRASGDIEQDADAVVFAYRPEYYLGKAPPEKRPGESDAVHAVRVQDWHDMKSELGGKAELIMAKVRDGDTGIVNMIFDGPTISFREVPTP